MIFSELYGAYYNAVSKIIGEAIDRPIKKNEIRNIVEKYAFSESIINIEAALTDEKWQLIKKDGTSILSNKPTMPLTTLQKRWLKAISLDPRICLFEDEMSELEDIVPLFTPDDICIFDKYNNGDPYEDDTYRKNFRLIRHAINSESPLDITTVSRNGTHTNRFVIMPKYLEYSEKDDKFRLIGTSRKNTETINLARITSCKLHEGEIKLCQNPSRLHSPETVVFTLTDERNALERVLLHFAHFKKQAEKIDDKHYRISVTYEKDDETEILIRILSFGPMIKVIAPDSFISLIKKRLTRQKSCSQLFFHDYGNIH